MFLGVVRKVDTCLCGFFPRTRCLSSRITSEKVRAKPQPCFSPLCKQKCSLAFACVWGLEFSTIPVPVPQQAEEHPPFPPVPGRHGHGNYCTSEPLQVTKEARSFGYFVPCSTTKFVAILSINLFSKKCIVRVLTSQISSLACKALQVSSHYSVDLVSQMDFIDKLRLVTAKLLTTDLLDHHISVQETPPVRTQK